MKIRVAVAPGSGAQDDVRITAFADALEASGFDGVWLSDVPLAPVLDPLLGLALIAGRTRRLRLGANVVPLGRNPFLLAKELAQLDRLSDGRLLLSFVPGLAVAAASRRLVASVGREGGVRGGGPASGDECGDAQGERDDVPVRPLGAEAAYLGILSFSPE